MPVICPTCQISLEVGQFNCTRTAGKTIKVHAKSCGAAEENRYLDVSVNNSRPPDGTSLFRRALITRPTAMEGTDRID
jgi:hypothetical protein